MSGVKLQKHLADAGLGSRRYCERLIGAGRVLVNGVQAQIGQRVSPDSDTVVVDGAAIKAVASKIVIAVNKPKGILSACRRGREHGKLITEIVSLGVRMFPVGRLDRDSEGLLLLTNDGELAQRLSHPRYQKEKEYEVTLDRDFDSAQIDRLITGIEADGERLRAIRAAPISTTDSRCTAMLSVVLTEGHKRQVRRMFRALGYEVIRLRRVRIAGLELGNLKPGEWRQLTPRELTLLRSD